MRSAAILAQQVKEDAIAANPGGDILQSYSTHAATITEDDKIFLHGNPLRLITDILCPNCRLPRLRHPTTGKNSHAYDSSRDYCAKQPYIDKEGCDVYGRSLALEKPSKKSKAAKESKGKPDSPDSDDDDANGKAGEKPAATSIPSGKCPNCPRYMAFTRIAQHMDRCLGLSGRQSSKNAMSKINGNTPRDSRASTPKPPTAVMKKRKHENAKDSEEETEEGTAQAKKKKKLKLAKLKNGTAKDTIHGLERAVDTNLQRVRGAEKRPPGQGAENRD